MGLFAHGNLNYFLDGEMQRVSNELHVNDIVNDVLVLAVEARSSERFSFPGFVISMTNGVDTDTSWKCTSQQPQDDGVYTKLFCFKLSQLFNEYLQFHDSLEVRRFRRQPLEGRRQCFVDKKLLYKSPSRTFYRTARRQTHLGATESRASVLPQDIVYVLRKIIDLFYYSQYFNFMMNCLVSFIGLLVNVFIFLVVSWTLHLPSRAAKQHLLKILCREQWNGYHCGVHV